MFNMMLYSNDPLNNSICQQQPLHRLMHSKGCSLILSASLLGVGITITVMSLRSFSSTNKIFLVGPILMTVGILGMSRFFMQYLKKANAQRQRRNQVRSSNSWQNPQVHQRRTEVMEPHIDPMQTLHIPTLCHGIVQREDSESAIYLGPTDSEEGTYSDDPPPYDSVAINTGTLVTSRVQLENSISSSLPSLPPYDEGMVNPALDLSTETFPAPPPYEMVAVQPPSYSMGTDIVERPVRATCQTVHGTKRKTLNPTRRTVCEVAQRLVQSMHAEQAQRSSGSASCQVLQARNDIQEETLPNQQQRSSGLTDMGCSQIRNDPELTMNVDVLQGSSGRNDGESPSTRLYLEEPEDSSVLASVVSSSSSEQRSLLRAEAIEACSCANPEADAENADSQPHRQAENDELTDSENCRQYNMADISPVLLDGQTCDNSRSSREVLTVTVPSSDSDSLLNPSQLQSIHSDTDIVKTESVNVEQESCTEGSNDAFNDSCTTSFNTTIIKDQAIALESQYDQVFD